MPRLHRRAGLTVDGHLVHTDPSTRWRTGAAIHRTESTATKAKGLGIGTL